MRRAANATSANVTRGRQRCAHDVAAAERSFRWRPLRRLHSLVRCCCSIRARSTNVFGATHCGCLENHSDGESVRPRTLGASSFVDRTQIQASSARLRIRPHASAAEAAVAMQTRAKFCSCPSHIRDPLHRRSHLQFNAPVQDCIANSISVMTSAFASLTTTRDCHGSHYLAHKLST